MTKRIAVFACFVAIAAILSAAQTADEGFQTATVVSIDKQSADARHPEKGDQYKIAMRMGGVLYMCHASGSPSVFLDWSPNKEFPAREVGKVLEVKNHNSQIVELSINSKKTPK